VETGAPGGKPPWRQSVVAAFIPGESRGTVDAVHSRTREVGDCWEWSGEGLLRFLDRGGGSPGGKRRAQGRSSPSLCGLLLLQPGLLRLRSFFFNQSSFFGLIWPWKVWCVQTEGPWTGALPPNLLWRKGRLALVVVLGQRSLDTPHHARPVCWSSDSVTGWPV